MFLFFAALSMSRSSGTTNGETAMTKYHSAAAAIFFFFFTATAAFAATAQEGDAVPECTAELNDWDADSTSFAVWPPEKDGRTWSVGISPVATLDWAATEDKFSFPCPVSAEKKDASFLFSARNELEAYLLQLGAEEE